MAVPERLDGLSRAELIERARAEGAERPERMTRAELMDEIVRLTVKEASAQRRSRGWLGVARDLVASVVDAGLHLPEAAKAIRGEAPRVNVSRRPPVATVTLAEIYAAQGHTKKALGILNQVLTREPEHEVARALRDQIEAGGKPQKTERWAFTGPRPDSTATPLATSLEEAKVEVQPPQETALAHVDQPAPPSPEPPALAVEEPPVAASVVPPPSSAAPESSAAGFQREPHRLLIRHGARGTAVTWSIPAHELVPEDPDARWVVKLVGFSPTSAGAEQQEVEFETEQIAGSRLLSELSGVRDVRGVLALSSPTGFFPATVGTTFNDHGLVFCPRRGSTKGLGDAVSHLERVYAG